jgi:hypothetical protein
VSGGGGSRNGDSRDAGYETDNGLHGTRQIANENGSGGGCGRGDQIRPRTNSRNTENQEHVEGTARSQEGGGRWLKLH